VAVYDLRRSWRSARPFEFYVALSANGGPQRGPEATEETSEPPGTARRLGSVANPRRPCPVTV